MLIEYFITFGPLSHVLIWSPLKVNSEIRTCVQVIYLEVIPGTTMSCENEEEKLGRSIKSTLMNEQIIWATGS